MNIEPENRIPCLLPATAPLNKASSEEAFIITLTKLVTGSTSTSLVEIFGATKDTSFSREFKTTVELLDNKADGLWHKLN